MNWLLNIRLLPLLATLPFAGPVQALGDGTISGSQLESITRQVEQQTQRRVEQAMDRKLQQQIQASISRTASQIADLPYELSISTDQGEFAFRDILLDNGARTVERQWLATGTAAEISNLQQTGITILDKSELSGLGMTVVRFRVSTNLDSRKALESALPGLALDRNHIYAPQAEGQSARTGNTEGSNSTGICPVPVGIGMIDTSIATEHPMLQGTHIVQQRFLKMSEAGGTLQDSKAHGTAVASVMLGPQAVKKAARLPKGKLFNASVFFSREQNLSGATLGHLLEGLNWLADQPLSVINISLTGPDNKLLGRAIKQLKNKGIVMVAAVGNQGPSAPPLYPAAYSDVIGVTAVDSEGEIYRWANHGEQVMFSARGVAVPVAHPDTGRIKDSGTSLAAPVVSAATACRLATMPQDQVIPSLIGDALDLGEDGRDRRFGHGLLDL